ncbi:MAG TPA: hypothetical protein VHH32_10925 [Gemmatimonadales bacterium]|nr:hypothetical protein [Gemmatimonadales bacterium]
MSSPATRQALQRLTSPLRSRTGLAWCAIGIGTVALLWGLAAWGYRLGLIQVSYWVLGAWGIALISLAVVASLAWRNYRRLTAFGVARSLEELGAWRRGSLTGLLDTSARGTSAALLGTADQVYASEIDRRGPTAIQPIARTIRSLAWLGAVCLLAGTLAFTTAGPIDGTAAALWHPGRAWEATIAPVRLRAAQELVDRGQAAKLHIEAVGRRAATLWLRSPGESWKPIGVRLDTLGYATVSTPPLTSDVFARVTSGSRTSDTLIVRVRIPVFLGSLDVTARYPAYLGMESEPVPTGGDTLILPAGTRLETRGEVTAPLASAAWVSERMKDTLTVSGTRFRGSFTPARSGEYRLSLTTRTGAAITGDTVRLPVRIVIDSAPAVDIPVPGVDTLAPLSLKLPLVIDVRDDHSVTEVVVESRRISRLGLVDSARRDNVALPPERPDRAILTYTLDLNRRGLLPGDTVRYFAAAKDNAPRAHRGRSREYVLRLPTMSEVRSAQRQAMESVGSQLDTVLSASRRIERQTDDLARERPRSADGRGGERAEQALTFEEARRAERVATSQEALTQQAEKLKASLEALRRSAEAAGLNDSSWQRQLREVQEQLERALSPELREKLAALQQALRELDPERAKEALEQLAEAQKQLREALERSRELFRRAALEGDLQSLAQESRELAREQREWNQQTESADRNRAAKVEQQLAARADSLSSALQRVAAETAPGNHRNQLQRTADQARAAAGQRENAAKSAQQDQRLRARQQGEEASKSLEPIGDQLQQQRAQLQREWRQEVLGAIDGALAETSRLADRQLRVQEQLREGEPAGSIRSEQAAIEEGVKKLLDQMKQAGGKNALVSPQITAALGAAQLQMRQAREAISSAAPNSRQAAEQAGAAVDELNATAHQLLRARDEVAGAQSGSGLAEALERLAQLAQQQGGLGKQGAGLLPMAGRGAIQEQLRQLAAKQRALAQELEKLQGKGGISGAGQMADEAKELSRRLEAGRLDQQLVERQERLFRRMLDAGRTLQGREEDEEKERQSTTATEDSVRLPPALRARLRSEDGIRVPTWEELQQLSPEERRLVVDYFRRVAQPSSR